MEKLLSRVKNILVSPKTEWEAIKAEQTTAKEIIFEYVAILAAIPAVASMIGLKVVGISFMGMTMRYSFGYVIVFGVLLYVMSIVAVIVAGAVINGLAPSFESNKDSLSALKVAAYSYTPALIMGVLSIIPALDLLWILGSLYGIYLLYLGLTPLMETSQNKAMGYTVVSIIVMIAVAIVAFLLVKVITAIFVGSDMPAMLPPQQ